MSSSASIPLGYCVSEVRRKNLGGREQNLLSLSYGRIIRKDIESVEGLLPESFDTYNIVEPGDTVLRLTDLQNDQRSLRVGIVEERGIITSAYVTVRPTSRINERFLNYFLKMMDFRKDFYALGAGVRQSLKFEELRRVQVAVPDLAAQRAIADYLDTETARIDALIAKKQRMVALVDELEATQLDMFMAFDVDVPRVRLGYVARLQTGLTLDGNREADASLGVVTVPYLRVANVQAGSLNLAELKVVTVPLALAQRCLLARGDVLMTEGGDLDKLGRGTVWNAEVEPCLHQNHVFSLRCDRSLLLPEFLAYLTRTSGARMYFESTGTRSTNLASTNSSKVLAFKVPLPSIEAQRSCVEAIRRRAAVNGGLRDRLARQIDLLREHRQTLITAAVTGEFEVPGVAA